MIDRERTISKHSPALDGRRGKTGQVLVVDDDPALLRLASAILEDAGYTVRTASDGLQALDRVDDRPPDLILLDIQMPVMDGPTFVRELRSRSIDPPIPIVLVSGEPDARQQAADLRVEDFLSKPFDVDRMQRMVSRHLPLPAIEPARVGARTVSEPRAAFVLADQAATVA